MKLGLLGEKLSHSLSPKIHQMALSALDIAGSYELIEVAPEDLSEFMHTLKDGVFDGINVTIPYKKTVMTNLDDLSEGAERIGAVNTILREGNRLIGYNTDYDGFGALLKANCIKVLEEDFTVLGAGGAAHGVLAYLSDHGAKSITLVSRSPKKAEVDFLGLTAGTSMTVTGYDGLNLTDKVLVNTTPMGMHPKADVSPIPSDALLGCKAVVDLIYNPSKTKLMLDAESLGVPAANGLYMLVAQAIKAEEIWQGRNIDACLTRSIHRRISGEQQNLVIIGMPGSGKTTVGRMLAERLEMDYFDMDAYIEQEYGSISDLFEKSETHFRDIESKTAKLAARKSNTVICTGGGVVKRGDNMEHLAKTGCIFFLDRPVEQIFSDVDETSRPLLQKDKTALFRLYDERIARYKAYAHCIIANDKDAETAANRILEKWQGER